MNLSMMPSFCFYISSLGEVDLLQADSLAFLMLPRLSTTLLFVPTVQFDASSLLSPWLKRLRFPADDFSFDKLFQKFRFGDSSVCFLSIFIDICSSLLNSSLNSRWLSLTQLSFFACLNFLLFGEESILRTQMSTDLRQSRGLAIWMRFPCSQLFIDLSSGIEDGSESSSHDSLKQLELGVTIEL